MSNYETSYRDKSQFKFPRQCKEMKIFCPVHNCQSALFYFAFQLPSISFSLSMSILTNALPLFLSVQHERTALHMACLVHHCDVAELLLKNGIDVFLKDKSGEIWVFSIIFYFFLSLIVPFFLSESFSIFLDWSTVIIVICGHLLRLLSKISMVS